MSGLSYGDFLGHQVTAFSSDSQTDFLRPDPAVTGRFGFTAAQRKVLDAQGVQDQVIFPKQVHGDVIWEVTKEDFLQTGVFEADAVVTSAEGLAVAVRTADCLPLLMAAPTTSLQNGSSWVIAAVHAGWKSTRLDIAAKTVALLKAKYAVDPSRIKAVIGPCIRISSYPVGGDFKEFFPKEVCERDGCIYFDIAAANVRQLQAEGVQRENISDCGCDTYSDKNWHSFRRDADASGRLIHVIMIKPKAAR